MGSLVFLALLLGVMYFILIRPQQRQMKEQQACIRSLEAGMIVVTNSGIHGAIAEVDDAPQVLVNNAGLTRDNLLLRMGEEEWSGVIEANVKGLYRVTKAMLRGMIKARWGRIVNLSSVVARMGNPGQSNYVASKASIAGFSRALAMEVAARNITVNAVAPGFIGTDMTAELTEHQTAAMLERVPLGRMGEAAEVASAVAYLVSEEAAYITAQTLHVNGGLYAG